MSVRNGMISSIMIILSRLPTSRLIHSSALTRVYFITHINIYMIMLDSNSLPLLKDSHDSSQYFSRARLSPSNRRRSTLHSYARARDANLSSPLPEAAKAQQQTHNHNSKTLSDRDFTLHMLYKDLDQSYVRAYCSLFYCLLIFCMHCVCQCLLNEYTSTTTCNACIQLHLCIPSLLL